MPEQIEDDANKEKILAGYLENRIKELEARAAKRTEEEIRAAEHAKYKNNYAKNKDKYMERKNKSLAAIKEWYKSYKSNLGCCACGNKDYRVLDFIHRNPQEKLFLVSQGIHRFSREKMLTEIAKCDLFCSNCARKHNARKQTKYTPQSKFGTMRASLLAQLKSKRGCSCGERSSEALDFHHIDQENKSFTIAEMKGLKTESQLIAEAGKCEVLCANCHRIRHCEEREAEKDGSAPHD